MTVGTETQIGNLLTTHLADEYARLLEAHIAEPSETILHHAYELGRQAVSGGTSVLDMAILLHHNALSRLLQSCPPETHSDIIRKASAFFAESLSPFEMLLRRYRESNASLSRLYEQAKALDRLKTDFFSNVSHELRTPLTLILGPLSRVLETMPEGSRERHDLEIVYRNAQILLRHVNDLLDFARIEAGKLDLAYAKTDVAVLTRLTASHFETLAEERHIHFDVQAPAALMAEVDAARLQRILLNLLSNAFKFTPDQGTIEMTLSATAGAAVFTVADSGPGIPENMRESVFERFRQVDGGAAGGTGLGLAIVREFCNAHGGAVTVDSSPNGGARITVTLPLKAPTGMHVADASSAAGGTAPEAAQAAAALRAQSRPDIQLPSAPGATVLVVEDNIDMRNFLAGILGERFRVITAANGREGVELAAAQLPDLILTDVMMPEMSGDEMARKLLSMPETRDIPVLLLTAKTEEALRVDMAKAGIRDYMTKPFSTPELLAKVEQHVSRYRKTLAERAHLVAKLERTNEELERFAYVAAHDLKSPLRAIDNLSSWLEEDLADRLDDASRKHLTELRRRVRWMEKLLNDILEYSRAGADIGTEIVSGTELLDEVLKTADLAGATVKRSGDFATIRVPRMPLKQVLFNLVDNAVKHGGKHNGGIEVGVDNRKDDYLFSVRDHGPGIAKQYHKKIFEMFQTLGGPKKGSGIGLALVKKVVVAHGGDVTVESEPGQGTTFRFTWPKTGEAENEPRYHG